MKNFLTASEVARECGLPVNRVIAAAEIGAITPDGRAGSNKNAAIIFDASRLESIKTTLNGGRSK
ncbi:MAG: hypothetical protein NTZ94_07070 [Verrucomicrobia bacterium]|nr:hypothetical protein [Verrucomicrobiota bacterium]